MTIRRATATDADAITNIWNHYIRNSTATFNSRDKMAGDLATAIANPETPFFVSTEDGNVTGFATYSDFRKGIGYAKTKEHTINLAPDIKGRGTGRALLQTIESHAKTQGIHSLFAGVSAENTIGIAFHRACGYREVARLMQVGWKFDRWHDLVLMQKIL